eukprot:2937801-Rhodomonas_salina.1
MKLPGLSTAPQVTQGGLLEDSAKRARKGGRERERRDGGAMSVLVSAYARAMQCLQHATISLHTCYAMSGTGLARRGISGRGCELRGCRAINNQLEVSASTDHHTEQTDSDSELVKSKALARCIPDFQVSRGRSRTPLPGSRSAPSQAFPALDVSQHWHWPGQYY